MIEEFRAALSNSIVETRSNKDKKAHKITRGVFIFLRGGA